jgi:hypothetical protein
LCIESMWLSFFLSMSTTNCGRARPVFISMSTSDCGKHEHNVLRRCASLTPNQLKWQGRESITHKLKPQPLEVEGEVTLVSGRLHK